MFQIAIRRGLLERMPLFPKRLEENPPRDGFFEHDEYLKVRAQAPASYQDVLDFAYYSGWRRNETLHLTWAEVDLEGGVIGCRRAARKRGAAVCCRSRRRCMRCSNGAFASGRPVTPACFAATASRSASGAPRYATRAGRPTYPTGCSTIVAGRQRGT
jgi:integrase